MEKYSPKHKEIVYNLLDGKFIIYPDVLFLAIQEQNDEYKEFFLKSFGYELMIEPEYAYLTSSETNEKRTRDFTLFLAILCRELDYNGKNFKDAIESSIFEIEEVEQLLKQSSKWEILEKTSVVNFSDFITIWHKKNLINKINNQQFKFTKAVKVFFDFAINVANAKLLEQNLNLKE